MKHSPTPRGVVKAIAAAEPTRVLHNLVRLALSDPDAYEKLSHVFTSAQKPANTRSTGLIAGAAV